MAAKVVAAVVGCALHIDDKESKEQIAKIVQLANNIVPLGIQGMMENLPVELQGLVLAAYEDENGEIKWGRFPASEVKNGRVTI